jgi:hypothetical protein
VLEASVTGLEPGTAYVLALANETSGGGTLQPRLNAQLIGIVSGRPKTSIALAVKQLQRKKLITCKTDIADSRRRVLYLTESGRNLHKSTVDA